MKSRIRWAIVFVAGLTLVAQLGVAAASAAGNTAISSVTVTSGNAQYSSQVVVNFATPLTASQAQTVTQTIDSQLGAVAVAGSGATSSSILAPAPSSTYYYPISCSSGDNLFTDSDGTFGVRNNCPYNVFNWHFRLSSYWQSVAISLVTETGMGWLRNGNSMPTGARHVDPADYLFHGTLNPVYVGDKIFYTDHFDFTVDIGGNVGSASMLINGYLQATA